MSTETLATLTDEYRARIAESPEYRPNLSADEALAEVQHRRHEAQLACERYDREATYLRSFLERWEKAEAAEPENADRFEKWRATRKWWHDLRDSEVADASVDGPGYCYEGGLWIRLNADTRQELGRYWTMCPFDLWGDLDKCERALWAEYA